MGIRFYCPNGHKLNVKDYQAGQKGLCPHCGVKIQIPYHSTRPSSHEAEMQIQGVEAEPGVPTVSTAPLPTVVEPASPTLPAAPAPTVAMPQQPIVAIPVASPAAQPVYAQAASAPTAANPYVAQPATVPYAAQPAAPYVAQPATFTPAPVPPASVPSTAPADPLAEAGNVVWYVRPPAGGQYGPAPTDVMRSWLAEGRVTADSLVWREGWRDWQEAVNVFPQLSAQPMAAEMAAEIPQPAISQPGASHTLKQRSQARRTQIVITIGLAVTVIVLFIVLLVILFNQ